VVYGEVGCTVTDDKESGVSLDRAAAMRREHAEIVRFCRQLGDEEWRAPSAAPGWRVQDVVAHLGGSCHAIFTPTSLKLLSSKDIERTNDVLVARRRDWEPARVLAEFERWGRRLGTLTSVLSRTPVARVPAPLGELGRFPAAVLLSSAFLFDQHTHLRHDIAPALGPVRAAGGGGSASTAESPRSARRWARRSTRRWARRWARTGTASRTSPGPPSSSRGGPPTARRGGSGTCESRATKRSAPRCWIT
jgi:hypothetical protein